MDMAAKVHLRALHIRISSLEGHDDDVSRVASSVLLQICKWEGDMKDINFKQFGGVNADNTQSAQAFDPASVDILYQKFTSKFFLYISFFVGVLLRHKFK